MPLELPKADVSITLRTTGPKLTSECYHLCFKGQKENALVRQLESGQMGMSMHYGVGVVSSVSTGVEKEEVTSSFINLY